MTTNNNTAETEFERGQAFGRKHELLRAAVLARIAYWDALKHLEDALTGGEGFSDKANDAVIDCIDNLAAAAPNVKNTYDGITAAHLEMVIGLVEKNPNK